MDNVLKKFVIAGLRRMSYRWPPRSQCRAAARISRGKYKCNNCGGIFSRKDTCVDHVIPVVTEKGFTTWEEYIERLFCPVENFQVLCIDPCHKEKTLRETKGRKFVRDIKKKCNTE